ncbi:hypothetical protein Tco_0611916, partial [Tanacetum coccineum]
VRDSGYLADVEVDRRETSLRDDVIVRGSDKPHLEHDIDECFAYADALRDRGIDARVVVYNTPKIRSQRNGNNGVLRQSTKIKI